MLYCVAAEIMWCCNALILTLTLTAVVVLHCAVDNCGLVFYVVVQSCHFHRTVVPSIF